MVVVSRLGAASAPWVAQYLMEVHDVLPFTVMGGLGLIAGILCFKLRETNGQPTAETLGDEGEGTVFYLKRYLSARYASFFTQLPVKREIMV